MQTVSKRIGAIIATACMLVALAFGATYAVAAGEFPPDGTNNLTVHASNSQDEAFKADIATANVVVEVYKIADAVKDSTSVMYHYNSLIDGISFEGVTTTDAWNELAIEVAKKIESGTTAVTKTHPADGATALEGLDDGLYLVMPHGASVTPSYGEDVVSSLVAFSDMFEYSFTPSITAAPTKEADENGVISTAADYGEWTRDIVIALKPEQKPLYGSLRIDKQVENFSGEPATFVFHITSTEDSPYEYDNYASVYYTGGESASTTVTHIKAGTIVTVTEDYSGARFELVEGDSSPKTIVADSAVSDEKPMASAAFKNKPNDSGKGGHGIENNYAYGENKNWEWKSATPLDEAEAGQPSAAEPK